jgi:DNA mismatch repair ATPase MutS
MNKIIQKIVEYKEAEKETPNGALLFVRLGDFYEAYGKTAGIVSRQLGTTLTKRGEEKMTGFGAWSVYSNTKALWDLGFLVAFLENGALNWGDPEE